MAGTILIPSKCTYITNKEPDKNFCTGNVIFTGTDRDGFAYRSILHFDLSGLPLTAEVESAVMKLYATFPSYSATGVFATPYMLSSEWHGHCATWNQQPETSRYPCFEPVNIRSSGWHGWDITEMVKLWQSKCLENHGLTLASPENKKKDLTAFISQNYWESKCRPFLEIKYLNAAPFMLASRRTASLFSVYDTSDEHSYSHWNKTASYSLYTFFVKNSGSHPATVFLQISPDMASITDEPGLTQVEPGSTKALTAQKYGFFTRLAFISMHPGKHTRLETWFQAQV